LDVYNYCINDAWSHKHQKEGSYRLSRRDDFRKLEFRLGSCSKIQPEERKWGPERSWIPIAPMFRSLL